MVQELKWRATVIVILLAIFSWALITQPLNQGLDLKGGGKLLVEGDLTGVEDGDSAMNDVRDVLTRRLDDSGLAEIAIRRKGDNLIDIEVPGATKEQMDDLRTVVTKPGTLEFVLLAEKDGYGNDINPSEFAHLENADDLQALTIQGVRWAELEKTESFYYKDSLVRRFVPLCDPKFTGDKRQFTGKDLKSTHETIDQNGGPAVGFNFNTAKSQEFFEFTRDHVGRRMAIVVDGKVNSAPTIQDPIAGSGIITGYDRRGVKNLIITLKNGSLSVPLAISNEAMVDAVLGHDQIEKSKLAVGLGFLLVVSFMALYYGAAGMVANVALLCNLLMLLGALAMFNATLTLPGIVGILLTLGMAVDANILVNERIREEMTAGKTMRQALVGGSDRAWVTIFDANMTTMIAAFILFTWGEGPVRGFGITLAIGIITTLICQMFVARTILDWLVYSKIVTSFRFRSIFKQTPSWKIMQLRHTMITASLVVIIAGVAVVFANMEKMLSIDFKGGSAVSVSFDEPQYVGDVRAKVESIQEGGQQKYEGLKILTLYDPLASQKYDAGHSKQFEISTKNPEKDLLVADLKKVFAGRLQRETVQLRVFSEDDQEVAITDANGERLRSESLSLPSKAKFYFHLWLDRDPGLEALKADIVALPRFGDAVVESAGLDGKYYHYTVKTGAIDLSQASLLGKDSVVGNFNAFEAGFKKQLGGKGYVLHVPFPSQEKIGPGVAHGMLIRSVILLLLAFAGIIVYVTFRFGRQWSFGIAGVIALLHDVVITFGFCGLAAMCADTSIGRWLGLGEVQLDTSMIAVFLTIIGYSINDTIVVFDRIRENLRGARNPNLPAVIDRSVNETLARSFLTSGTVFLSCLSLFFIGGKTIHNIAYGLLVGIVVGTYSTTFIASPFLLLWSKSAANVVATDDEEEAPAAASSNSETTV